tara:strand:- start:383 stop:1054 length:672 start_codon:yes stop_codon:yes gene_type:complete
METIFLVGKEVRMTVSVAVQTPDYWVNACAELCEKDRLLAEVIEKYPEPTLSSKGDLFSTLIRSIIGQQISVYAADAVWGRFNELVGSISPSHILNHNSEELRNCGLTNRKVEYIHAISQKWEQEYANLDWDSMTDAEVKRKLVALRGVGPWTAEMILMFSLLRPDVFPIDDIGAIRAIENIYNGGNPMSKQALLDKAEEWIPWRTVATWFLWRTIDDEPVEY